MLKNDKGAPDGKLFLDHNYYALRQRGMPGEKKFEDCEVCFAISPQYLFTDLDKLDQDSKIELKVNDPSPIVGKNQLLAFKDGIKFSGFMIMDGTLSVREHFMICLAFSATLPKNLISYEKLTAQAEEQVQLVQKRWDAEIGPTIEEVLKYQNGVQIDIGDGKTVGPLFTFNQARENPICLKHVEELKSKYVDIEQIGFSKTAEYLC